MLRLGPDIPAWVSGYIGVPFKDLGRDRDGVDCWGLVRLVYAERFQIDMPSFTGDYAGVKHRDAIDDIVAGQVDSPLSRWRLIGDEAHRVGDVGLFRIQGHRAHVGLAIARGKMLHSLEGVESCWQRVDDPQWIRRRRGWYRYAGPVRFVSRVTPFSSDRCDVEIPYGGSLEDILDLVRVKAAPGLRLFVAGVEVPRAAWPHVKPAPGRLVTAAVVPEGGGGGGNNKTLRVVLSIAVVAAAIAAPYAVGLAGEAAVAAGTASGLGASLVSAGVLVAGTLAVNALVPPSKPRLSLNGSGDDRRSPAIQGSRNQARPFQPIPVVLGRHRLAPMYGAQPYTEIVADDQYLRLLFVPGYGPLELSDFKIGETPIEEFDGVEIEVRNGYADDAPLSLYPGMVHEDGISTLLTQVGSWTTRTTQTGTQEISVDITFPSGLVEFGSDGGRSNKTVVVEVQYRQVGTLPWLTVNGDGGTTGSPLETRGMDLMFRTPEAEVGGAGYHTTDLSWSTLGEFPGAKPGYLPGQHYSWRADGYLYVAAYGTYEFSVDSSDAADVFIDGQRVADWYGTHAPSGAAGVPDFTQSGTKVNRQILLRIGYHKITVRMESRGVNGGAIAVGMRALSGGPMAVIPASRLFRSPYGAHPDPGLLYAWYTTALYQSNIATTEARADPIRRNLSWAVPGGQYEVRLRRLTADAAGGTNIVDLVYWTALRSINGTDPIARRGIAKIALRIKGTDQLNGIVDEFNCVATSVVPDYDEASGTWVERGTSSPAACYRAVLQGSPNKRPVADERLDLAELEAWSVACAAKGLEFNAVIDFSGTVYERLADVAAAGRASFGMRNGKYSVVRDVAQTVPVQHFTPRNSRNFRGRKVFPDLPHAFKVRYINAAAGYQQDERPVYRDGFDANTATLFETLEIFGVTSADEAWLHGRYHLAVAILRPEVFELETDVEHLVCNRGDLVRITHDVPLFGLASGRVTGLTLDGANQLTFIDVDQECPMGASDSYQLRIRRADGTSFVWPVVTNAGGQTHLQLTPPAPLSSTHPEIGDLFMFGPVGQESRQCLVKGIKMGADLSAVLELVDYNEGIYAADTGSIPPYDSGITLPPVYAQGPEDPVIDTMRSDDYVMVRDADGSLRPRIQITLEPASTSRPPAESIQVRTRPKPVSGAAQGPFDYHPLVPLQNRTFYIEGVREGITYEIRIRAIDHDGRASAWVSATHTVVGKVLPPPDVDSFDVSRLADGTRRYTWDLGSEPPDVAGVLIRYGAVGAAWGALTPLQSDPIEGASPFETNLPLVSGTRRYAIKMVDTSGNESTNMVWVEKDLGAPPQENVVVADDCRASNWPGTKTGCFISAPDRPLEANDSTTWATTPATYTGWTRWNLNPTSPIVYEHTAVDAGFEFDFEPAAYAVGDGTVLVEVKYSSDGIAYSAYADVTTFYGVTVRARYLKCRVTVTATGPYPVPLLRELLVMMRAKQKVHDVQDQATNGTYFDSAHRIGVGDIRIPVPAGLFSRIRFVNITFNGTGVGWTWEVIDKDATLGPRVKLYDTNGAPADATIDALIRGL